MMALTWVHLVLTLHPKSTSASNSCMYLRLICSLFYVHRVRGHSQWTRGSTWTNFGRASPLLSSIFFIFMHFSGKFGQIIDWRSLPVWGWFPSAKSRIRHWYYTMFNIFVSVDIAKIVPKIVASCQAESTENLCDEVVHWGSLSEILNDYNAMGVVISLHFNKIFYIFLSSYRWHSYLNIFLRWTEHTTRRTRTG